MIHAISMTPQVGYELVTAPRHWGAKVKGFLINTLGSWRDKILTAAAVYELVQAIFLVLGGYFLAGVISAAMSALFVKTIKDLKEFANLDRATSVIKEEGYRYGLLNLQHRKNNAEFQQSIEQLKQENEKFTYQNLVLGAHNAQYGLHNLVHGAHNEQYGQHNLVHGAHNAVQQANNAMQQVNNEVHSINNTAHQANNAVHQANNAEQSSLNEDYRELQLQHAIMAEQLKELFENEKQGKEEFLELAHQNFDDYKSYVEEICRNMRGDAKAIRNLHKATKRIVENFEKTTIATIEMTREAKEKIQEDKESLKQEKQLFEQEKRELAELRKQYEAHILEAAKEHNEKAEQNLEKAEQNLERAEQNTQNNSALTIELKELAAKFAGGLQELQKYSQEMARKNHRQRPIRGRR